MKNQITVYTSILFLLISSVVSCQDYYWSGKKKIPIQKDSTTLILSLSDIDRNNDLLTTDNRFDSVRRLNRSAVLVKIKESEKAKVDF